MALAMLLGGVLALWEGHGVAACKGLAGLKSREPYNLTTEEACSKSVISQPRELHPVRVQ